MAAEKAAPQKTYIVVMSGGAQPYFNCNGLPRWTGEILPREGANMGQMEEAGMVRTLPKSAHSLIEKCECGRLFVDKNSLQAHVERGHDDGTMKSRFMPAGAEVVAVEDEQKELVCPPQAHLDKDEEGDGQIVRMWHPESKQIIPRRERSNKAWPNVSRADEI